MGTPKPVSEAFIECFDDHGDVAVRLEITPLVRRSEDPMKGLYEMDLEEAADEGLSTVQLEELCKYTYKFRSQKGGEAEGFKLAESKLVSQYSGQNLIETGNSAGHWTVQILDLDGKPVAKGSAEIRSSKMDYLQEYRGMIKGISSEMPKYLYELGAATDIPLVTEWSDDPPTLQQQVEFLRAVLGGREFRTAMMRIIRMPHEKLEQELEERSVMRAFKPGRTFQMQVAKGGSRVAVPPSHPLHARIPTLPASVLVTSKRRTLHRSEKPSTVG
jgi:hypothetical protein